MFNDNIKSGDNIIFDGKFDGERYSLTVNKEVNITSTPSTIFMLYTKLGPQSGTTYIGGIFQVINSGSNSNISNMNFENTRIYITNTSNVDINNITVYNGFAQNTGQFSLRNQSDNITVRNSYFKTKNNGGSSNVVLAGAKNSLIENNTIIGEGTVGNLFYLCGYYATMADNGFFNNNITIRNNYIEAIKSESDICYGITVEGKNILFDNNTVIHKEHAVNTYFGDAENITFINNNIPYGTVSPKSLNKLINNSMNEVYVSSNASIINNTINTLYSSENCTLTNNIINTVYSNKNNIITDNNIKSLTINSDNNVENNTIDIATIEGDNVLFNNNNMNSINYNYSVEVKSGTNISITNNELSNNATFGDNAIIGSADLIENNNGYEYIFINDENYENYGTLTINKKKFDYDVNMSTLPENCFINIQSNNFTTITFSVAYSDDGTLKKINLINLNAENLPNTTRIEFNFIKSNIINSNIPNTNIRDIRGNEINLINSTVKSKTISSILPGVINIDENSVVLTDIVTLENNTEKTGYLSTKKITYPNTVYVSDFNNAYDLIINQPINLTNLGEGNVNRAISFISGSEGSNITGITFNDAVYINTTDISFKNNTFNKGVTLTNASNILIENNIVTVAEDEIPIIFINSSSNTLLNNSITGLNGTSIHLDTDSSNNTIKENNLNATTKLNIDSINDENTNNIISDNGILYDVKINIDIDNPVYIGEQVPVNINITNNLNNDPVDNGYVEIYADGILQDKINLTEGKVSTLVSFDRIASTRLRVWYYPTEKYEATKDANNVNVIESTGNIKFAGLYPVQVGDKITVTANIKSKDIIDEGFISFEIAGNTTKSPVTNNRANFTTTITPAMLDNPSLRATFESEKIKYNIESNITTLKITPGTTDIKLNEISSKINAETTIIATITDKNKENINDAEVIFSNDKGELISTTTVTDGIATINHTFTEEYSGKIIATLTSKYYENNSTQNLLNIRKINTNISLETLKTDVQTGETILLNGKLIDEDNNKLTYKNIKLNINDITYDLNTNDEGIISLPYTPTSGGITNITLKFLSDKTYNESSSNTLKLNVTDKIAEEIKNLTEENEELKEQINNLTEQIKQLTAPKDTILLLDSIDDAKYNANVTISGILINDDSIGLFNQVVTLTIGEKEVNVTTKGGVFEYIAVFKTLENQTVKAVYAGNDKYQASEDEITFPIAKQDVIVTIAPITDVAYGDTATITGKFTTAEGKTISNSNVRVVVNGKKYIARTDKTGSYSVDAKVTQVGENTVTVGYAGNTNYNAYEDTITFNADKQDVIVTVNAIEDTKVGENITITGTFTYANGKAVTNSNVKILINGKKYLAKTDSTGAYTLTTLVTKDGINNITVGYTGNDKLNAYEDTITFNAEAQDVIITADSVEDVTLGENVTITGKFTDKNGKAITNSVVRVTFDGKKYSARTDNTGSYTFTATTKTEGTNTITLNYAGSSKYNAYETSTTFNVIKTE